MFSKTIQSQKIVAWRQLVMDRAGSLNLALAALRTLGLIAT